MPCKSLCPFLPSCWEVSGPSAKPFSFSLKNNPPVLPSVLLGNFPRAALPVGGRIKQVHFHRRGPKQGAELALADSRRLGGASRGPQMRRRGFLRGFAGSTLQGGDEIRRGSFQGSSGKSRRGRGEVPPAPYGRVVPQASRLPTASQPPSGAATPELGFCGLGGVPGSQRSRGTHPPFLFVPRGGKNLWKFLGNLSSPRPRRLRPVSFLADGGLPGNTSRNKLGRRGGPRFTPSQGSTVRPLPPAVSSAGRGETEAQTCPFLLKNFSRPLRHPKRWRQTGIFAAFTRPERRLAANRANLVQTRPARALCVDCGNGGVRINDSFDALLLHLSLPQFPPEFSLSPPPLGNPTQISVSSPLRCHPRTPQSNPFGSRLQGLVSLTLGWGSRKVFPSSANDRKATFIPSLPRSWQERWNVDRERSSHLSGQQLVWGMG